MKNWVKELKKMLGNEITLAIVGGSWFRPAGVPRHTAPRPPSPPGMAARLCSRTSALGLHSRLATPAGNKIDLEKNRTVDQAKAEA